MVKGSLIYINRGDTHNLAPENLFLKLEVLSLALFV